MRPNYQLFAVLLIGALLSGCMNYLAPFSTQPAQPGLESVRHSALEELPPPKEKAVAAVYRFRDQTGQYKASESGASWSTAVTQGATAVLMRALEESGWFVVIEREGLSNLLNERQIIQSIRAQHTGPNGEQLGALPPLLYGGILLEGGIIGYDTNVLTGGAGVRYLGTGGSGQYRQDQVTVYLRAVSTQSGRVLKTVHTTKTIVSQKMDGGLFRYVDTNRILETEAGYSYNEPPVLAVTEAIEEAVRGLVIEGVRDDLWALADPADAQSEVFLAYDEDVERSGETDYFGRVVQDNRPGVALGTSFGAQRYQGNYRNPLTRPTGEFYVRGSLAPRWGLQLSIAAGEIGADRVFKAPHWAGDVSLLYYLLPRARLTPFLQGGLGVLAQSEEGGLVDPTWGDVFAYSTAAGGIEYMATPRLGLSLALSASYGLEDGLDGVRMGRIHDSVWSLKTGITLYPF